jgi:hypothetical protein
MTQADPNVLTQNNRGEWVPSIPLPYYIGRWGKCRCASCPRVFKKYEDHKAHYALVHILALD